jgi:hypothetical protein
MGSFKNDRNALANDSNVGWALDFSSTYHLVVVPVRVLSNNRRRMESSIILLEEHHKWKDMTWLVGSSLDFPSNLGMFEGSFVVIFGQVGSCNMGSFVNLVRSEILSESKKGMIGASPAMLWEEVVPWELVLCENVWALPPCGVGFVCELLGILVLITVPPSNHEPNTIALTGVCDGIVDVSAKLGTLPRIGGKFLKHLERRGYYGSPVFLA